MSAYSYPFKKLADPLVMPVAPSPQKFTYPDGFFSDDKYTAFTIVNPNAFWVRYKGSGVNGTGDYVEVTNTTGQLLPPGAMVTFSTQYPKYLSLLSVPCQGLPAGTGTVELTYGTGS